MSQDQKPAQTPNQVAMGCAGLVLIFLVLVGLVTTCSAVTGDKKDPKQPAKAAAPADLQAQTGALWTEVKGAIAICDARGKVAADAMQGLAKGTVNIVDAYRDAKSAHEACNQATLDLTGMKPPAGSVGENRKAFEEALVTCANAYYGKQEGFSKAMEILDGNMRLSTVAEFQELSNTTQAMAFMCIARFAAAGDTVGWTMPEFKEAQDKAKAKVD